MTYLLRTAKTAFAAATAALLFSTASCSKKEGTAPAPTTGSIEGTISPAGALATVTATNAGGLTFLATPNATTGAFSLPNLVPGTYTLSFTPASGYGTPAPRTAAVVAGQTTAAGTVSVVGNGTPRGTVSWTLNGANYTSTTLSGFIDNQGFRLEATAPNAASTDRVIVELPTGISAVGTYYLQGNGQGASGASYVHTTGATTVSYGTYLLQTSPTTGLSGSGTLVVSSFDAASRTMSGTFAFRAFSTDYGLSNVVWVDITNGTFSLRY